MTVSADSRRKEYQGNGVTTIFNGPMAFQPQDVQVFLTVGGVTSPVSPGEYEIDRFGRESGTRVVMNTPPPSGSNLLLLRTVPYSQDVDITNQGAFHAETIEKGFDALEMQIQQVQELASRSPHLSDFDTDGAGRYDANGNQLGNLADGVDSGDAVTLGQLGGLLSIPTGLYVPQGAGAVARPVQEKLREVPSLPDFGAIGDGATDNSAAVAAANTAGRPVFVPSGTFVSTTAPTVATYGPGVIKVKGIPWVRERGIVNNLFRKRILFSFDDRFSAYSDIRATYNYPSLYTSGVYLDEDDGLLYVTASPGSGGDNTWAWFIVYDTATMEEVCHFSAGERYAKSFAITKEGGSRYLYGTGGNGDIAKFDITTFPANGARLAAVSTISGTRATFVSEWGGELLTNYKFVTFSTILNTSNAVRRELDGTPIAPIYLPQSLTGSTDGDLADMPKMQGMAAGPGFIVCSYGGRYFPGGGDTVNSLTVQGVRRFTYSGKLIDEGMMDPEKLFDAVKERIYPTATRVEYEGASVSARGRVVTTLHVTGFRTLVLEEFSDADDAIDFSDCACVTPFIDGPVWVPRRSDEANGVLHPITGAPMTTFDDYIQLMRQFNIYKVELSTTSLSGAGITDYNSTVWPGSVRIVFTYSSNSTFFVEAHLTNYVRRFSISNANTSPAQNELPAFKMVTYAHSYGNSHRAEFLSSSAPSSGTWERGDRCYNTAPSAGGDVGWVCVASGTPGTWKSFGAIEA